MSLDYDIDYIFSYTAYFVSYCLTGLKNIAMSYGAISMTDKQTMKPNVIKLH